MATKTNAVRFGRRESRRFVALLIEEGDFTQVFEHEMEVELKIFSPTEWEARMEDKKLLQKDVLAETLLDAKTLGENNKPVAFDNAVKQVVLAEPWAVRSLYAYQSGFQVGLTSIEVKNQLLGNLTPLATSGKDKGS